MFSFMHVYLGTGYLEIRDKLFFLKIFIFLACPTSLGLVSPKIGNQDNKFGLRWLFQKESEMSFGTFYFIFVSIRLKRSFVLFSSLDVEGAEWQIVQNVPWSVVDIRVRWCPIVKY